MEHITIRAFRAPDDKAACAAYIREFVRVLQDIGVSSAFKPDISWCLDRESIVFVAEHPVHGMVGGIRLQMAKVGMPLPMVGSLKTLAPELSEHMAPRMLHGNAELGALWNAHRFAGRGIPNLLISAAVATANQLSIQSMCCLVAEYVAPYCRLNGFKPIAHVGENGMFLFPIPSIRSYAMEIADVLDVGGADEKERRRLVSLRLRPEQTRIEQPKREALSVTYSLLVDGRSERYAEVAAMWSSNAA